MRIEKIIVGEGTEYPLNGLLTLPDAHSEKVPAVVLVHGSGASNMDERIYKLTPFKDLAEGLAVRGIASIRYDKRNYLGAPKCGKKRGRGTEREKMVVAVSKDEKDRPLTAFV